MSERQGRILPMLVPRRSEGIRSRAKSNSISGLFASVGCVWNKAKDAPATAPPVMMAWEIAADSLMPARIVRL